MEEINLKYPIVLEVLTPLSVGCGNDLIEGFEYLVKDGEFYLLNLKKLIAAGFAPEKLNFPLSVSGLRRCNLADVSDAVKRMPATSSSPVKAQIKNCLSGKPIIPGSSIKGAIRSIMLRYLLNGGKPQNRLDEKNYFGSATEGTDIMRFIKFSDAEFDNYELINTKIYNLRIDNGLFTGGWKHGREKTSWNFSATGFNTIYEAIMPGSTSDTSLMLSPYCSAKCGKSLPDIHSLFEIINAHTRNYLSKEISFFSKYDADKSDEIVDSLKGIRKLIPSDNSYCIFKLAAGSGFHSITGDWQFDDYSIDDIKNNRGKNQGMFEGESSSKSRKVAIADNHLSLMGFMKMSIMDDTQVAEAQIKRQQRKEELIENCKISIETDKAIKEILDSKIEAEYESCISQLDSLDNKHLDIERQAYNIILSALSSGCPAETLDVAERHINDILSILNEVAITLQNAINKFPKHKDYLCNRNSKNEQCIKSKENQKAIIERNRPKPTPTDMGLIFLEEKYDDGPKKGCYKVTDFKGASSRIKQWLKKNHYSTIGDSELDTLKRVMVRLSRTAENKEKKMWSNYQSPIWNDIRKWCGEQWSTEMYEKLK